MSAVGQKGQRRLESGPRAMVDVCKSIVLPHSLGSPAGLHPRYLDFASSLDELLAVAEPFPKVSFVAIESAPPRVACGKGVLTENRGDQDEAACEQDRETLQLAWGASLILN